MTELPCLPRAHRDEALGVYLHVPFCAYRCAYCDFAIAVRQEGKIPEYLAAVSRELLLFESEWGRRGADSVYIGGGTPSKLGGNELSRLLEAISRHIDLAADAQISLEANPDDLSPNLLKEYAAAGITRITVGVQSVDPDVRRRLGRPSSAEQALGALRLSLEAGFDSVGADLIFGGPGQTLAGWMEELEQVLGLAPQHLSCYALETTSRTPLARRLERGDLPPLSADLAAEMYGAATRCLDEAGFERYEISNFARPGARSRQNWKYWCDEPYAGFGPAAASYLEGWRWTNPRRLSEYLRRAGRDPARPRAESYDPSRRAGEAIVFGLRKTEGIDLERLRKRHGRAAVDRREGALTQGVEWGILERRGERYRLSEKGLLLADELFVEVL